MATGSISSREIPRTNTVGLATKIEEYVPIRTPISSADELKEIGYKIAIFPGGAVRAIAHHLQAYYGGLLGDGNNDAFSEKMHDFRGLNDVIGTSELLELGKKYE